MKKISGTPYDIGLLVLAAGFALWAIATLLAVYFHSPSHFQRAGTILISFGVIALAKLTDIWKRDEEEINGIIREIDCQNDSAMQESATGELKQAREELLEVKHKVGSVLQGSEFLFIAFGTAQTGYGDLALQFLLGGFV